MISFQPRFVNIKSNMNLNRKGMDSNGIGNCKKSPTLTIARLRAYKF